MANRYWVGGTGNWSDDDNHWATSSGGSPSDGNLPTSSDDVFIDSNSGFGAGGTITLGESDIFCKNFTSNSGHTYTIEAYLDQWGDFYLTVTGSLILDADATYNIQFYLVSNNSSKTITINGAIISHTVWVGGNGDNTGEWTLQDDLIIGGSFEMDMGTFDANDHNITANNFYFYADTGYTPTVIMGSGTWEATGNDDSSEPWYVDQSSDEVVTIIPETSTIKFTDESEFSKTFYFYDNTANETGKTYNNIWFTGAGTGGFIITGSNTFNDFKVDTPSHNLFFEEDKTTTVTTFTVSGTAENLISLDSMNTEEGFEDGAAIEFEINNGGSGYENGDIVTISGGNNLASMDIEGVDETGAVTAFAYRNEYGADYLVASNVPTNGGSGSGFTVNILQVYDVSQHILSKSSGTVVCDYLDISNSNATGGATWYAGSHSEDTTNNDGWIFEDAPSNVVKDIIQPGIIIAPR